MIETDPRRGATDRAVGDRHGQTTTFVTILPIEDTARVAAFRIVYAMAHHTGVGRPRQRARVRRTRMRVRLEATPRRTMYARSRWSLEAMRRSRDP